MKMKFTQNNLFSLVISKLKQISFNLKDWRILNTELKQRFLALQSHKQFSK